MTAVTAADVRRARGAVADVAWHTPVLPARTKLSSSKRFGKIWVISPLGLTSNTYTYESADGRTEIRTSSPTW